MENIFVLDDMIAGIIAEGKKFADNGGQELSLAVQDIIDDESDLHCLSYVCKELAKTNIWVRLQDICPQHYQALDEVLALMKEGEILPYIDIALKHRACADKEFLDTLLERISNWREKVPDVTVRATMTFADLTDEQYLKLLYFVEQAQLYRINFSPTLSNTDAETEQATAQSIKRVGQLQELQDSITHAHLLDMIGSVQPVIIDSIIDDEIDGEKIQNVALGRLAGDAPDIDGIVQIEDIYGAERGQIVHIEIVEVVGTNVIAVPF